VASFSSSLKVGIGITSSLDRDLHIKGSGSDVGIQIEKTGVDELRVAVDSTGPYLYAEGTAPFRIYQNNAEIIRINESDVGIGCDPASQNYKLKVQSGGPQVAHFENSQNTNSHIAIGNSSHTQYSNLFASTDTGNYQIWHNGSTYTSFGTGANSMIIYNSTGDITFNPSGQTTPEAVISAHGLAFNTATPTANNSIHAYQDATAWTPRLFKGSTEITSPTARYGYYMQIGDLVWVSFYFYKSSGSLSSSGNWRIYGLPFNITSLTNGAYQFIPAGYMTLNGTNEFNEVPYRWQGNSTTYFELYGRRGTTNWTSSSIEMAGSGVINTYP
tara:strand:- start:333 stop:1319 length:987 start_codon:yes stop_codon:yes gene_type:complete